jgi:hypothetical protein
MDASDYPQRGGGSGLLDHEDFESNPSLFNLNHPAGTTFVGKIVGEVRQVHSTCHPDTRGPDGRPVGERRPQYFQRENPSDPRSRGTLTLAPVSTVDGRTPNDPVMDQVVTIATGQIDPSIEDDNGVRAWFVQGSKKMPAGHKIGDPVASARRALLDAVKASRVIFTDEDWDGKNIEISRVRRTDPSKANSPWLWTCRIWAD